MRVKLTQLVKGKYILQALQRNRVAHLDEFTQRLPADAPRRTEGGRILRILRLQLLQPAQLVVVIIIAHLRVIQYIVEIARMLQLFCQLFNFLFRFHKAPNPLLQ